MQTICTLLQTDNHTNTSSLNFLNPNALPDAQPNSVKAQKGIIIPALVPVKKNWEIKGVFYIQNVLFAIQLQCQKIEETTYHAKKT